MRRRLLWRLRHGGGSRPIQPRTGSRRPGRRSVVIETPDRGVLEMLKVGLIVRLEAKAGKEAELSAFLRGALPLVDEEPRTVVWLGVQTGPSSFAILDPSPTRKGGRHTSGVRSPRLLWRRPAYCSPALRR